MESESSLPRLQATATCPCPEPDQSCSHPPTLIKVHFNIIPKCKCVRILKIQFIPRLHCTKTSRLMPYRDLKVCHPRCVRSMIQSFSVYISIYMVGQLSSRTRHRVLAVAALDKSLSMVCWRWHISVSQLCCCWSMAVSFWVASVTVCVCFGVPPRECRSLN